MAGIASGVYIILLLLQILLSECLAQSRSTVKYLPGFQGPLPFHLETGYIGVGDSEDVQLFYYFLKSERDPENDPLILWFTGGPGCSALSGLAFEIGPLNFKIEAYNGSLPQFILNPYSWTKVIILFQEIKYNIHRFTRGHWIFICSESRSSQHRSWGQVRDSLQFLRKWLLDHPEFISNPFYVGGDSYSGLIVPVVAHEILQGNKHTLPFVNFQGYILGNPVTIRNSRINFQVPFAHRMTLISDELFESLTANCKGEYVHIDPSNVECSRHYDTYTKCVSKVKYGHILLPECPMDVPQKPKHASDRRSLHRVLLDSMAPLPSLDCPNYQHFLSYFWANDDQVRKALHIHEGSIGEWIRCNKQLPYNYGIDNVVPYHVKLSSRGYRSLVYSGDHDMVVPHMDTEVWIKSLNYSIVDDWRPWYTRTYGNKMTYATIKGGGHTAEYTQKECSIVFDRWISGKSLYIVL